MPITQDRMYNPGRLNCWFAVSSLLMLGSIVWLIAIDYDRPWRGFQDRYYLTKAALAHLEYLDRMTEIENAHRRLEDAEEYVLHVTGSRREELMEELAEVDPDSRKSEEALVRPNQVLRVPREAHLRTLGAHEHDLPPTQRAHERPIEREEKVDQLRKENRRWEKLSSHLEAEPRELESPLILAKKQLRELEEARDKALEKDQQYRGICSDEGLLGGLPIAKTILNFPLFDFAAPKNTPARHQINQLVLPDVRQQLNFLESYTVDRCTTCHVAIDDQAFSREGLAKILERALPAIHEVLEREGRAPVALPDPPRLLHSNQALPIGRVTDYWSDLTQQQQEDYFKSLLQLVNHYLRQNGRKTIKPAQPILAHPELDFYVSVVSPHPMAKMGCTVCHEGNPQETDFVLSAHTPATPKARERWKEKYYTSVLGVPSATLENVEHSWDRQMHLLRYTEAACAKCHTQITDVARFRGERKGARINMGRYLFTAVGCVNCHNVDQLADARRVGPDLTHVASKLKPEFVQPWVFFPQKFRPSTRMPHFFLQENNRTECANSYDPQPILRTETEVAAITKYLFGVSKEWHPISPPEGVWGDVERGRQLFRSAGCLGCHANLAEFGQTWITDDIAHREGIEKKEARRRYSDMTHEERVRYAMGHFVNERDSFLHPEKARFDAHRPYNTPIFTRFAPELSGIGSKVTYEWLYSWLIDPTHYAPETTMPSLRLTSPEAADIAAYLMILKNGEFKRREFDLNKARRRMVDELVFTLLSAQRSERHSRAIMNDASGELTDMLVSLIGPSVGRQRAYQLIGSISPEDKKLMYLGNKMIAHYGCYACHTIPGFEGTPLPGSDLSNWAEKPVNQLGFAFYDRAFGQMRDEKPEIWNYINPLDAVELNYWSPTDDLAREQIVHTHAAFAKHTMLNPRIWDREKIKQPYIKLTMPNFYFTEEEAEALTTYLLSRMPPRVNDVLKVDYDSGTAGPIARGRNLTRELSCVACHEIEDNAPLIRQYFRRQAGGRIHFDATNAPPSLWGEGAKVQPSWLRRFLQHVEPLRPWLQVRMPSFHLTDAQAAVLAEYFAALSQQHAADLLRSTAPVDAYRRNKNDRAAVTTVSSERDDEAGKQWYERESLAGVAAELRRWAIERKLVRAKELDPLQTSPDRVRAAHEKLLDRVKFLRNLYDVQYPFVEPLKPLSSQKRFEQGLRFFMEADCLKCHVLGSMLRGPAKNTDDFVQMYSLDSVRGEGDEVTIVLNGRPYRVGAVIDGHTVLSAANIYHDSGGIETQAIFEGPNADGELERIMLQAPSAPDLSLTNGRLRRAWVINWMLEPQWMQPGTAMPQNFRGGQSQFEGDPDYPGTGIDHINLLVDFIYHAGATNTRVPVPKIVVTEETGEFEDRYFEEEDPDDEELND